MVLRMVTKRLFLMGFMAVAGIGFSATGFAADCASAAGDPKKSLAAEAPASGVDAAPAGPVAPATFNNAPKSTGSSTQVDTSIQ